MTIRIGIIGAGGIARAHARGYEAIPEKARIAAYADTSDASIARFRSLAPEAAVHRDYRAMLEREALDAVDICLPHHLHAEAILAACERGLAWLCEKPLCVTLEEADRIAQAVERSGVVAMCAHNQIFMPALLEARRWIEQRRLGAVYAIISQDCFILARPKPGAIPGDAVRNPIAPDTWRARRDMMGGGELIDTGYHPTYRLLYLAGSPFVEVVGMTSRFRQHQLDGEDAATVLVRFESGVVGTIRTSWAFELPAGHAAFHVIGEAGQLYGDESTLWFRPDGWEPARFEFEPADTFARETEHFADCLIEGRPPLAGLRDGIDVLRLIRAVYDREAPPIS